MKLTIEEIKKADKATLTAELSNRVYAAAILLEQMENAGRIGGNGHHHAQDIAKYAEDKLNREWIS